MPAFPCLSCPSFTTPTSLSRPAMPVLVPPVSSFPDRTFRRLPHLAVAIRTRPHLNAPRLPYLIDPIRDFPNPTITRPNSPCLPDLNSPCITFRLATLTHLACRAFIIPTVPLPSIPLALNYPFGPNVNSPLHACHLNPCPTQTLAANLHPPFRACFVFNGDYSSPLRTSTSESTPWFQVKNLNYWLLIAFLK